MFTVEGRNMSESLMTGRVLFFSEAATLAHVARPMVLAKALEAAGNDVHFACDGRYRHLFETLSKPWLHLESIPTADFLQALANGRPVYDSDRLASYVEEDLKLIKQCSPDIVVGDFRLSLAISARLAGVPYISITNAYWSPYSRPDYCVPDLPMNRYLGFPLANRLFRMFRPAAFALHTRPFNRVAKQHGLPSLGLDLRRIYTDSDYTLYADLPELIPTYDRPDTHHYLGPINWSPDLDLPSWWGELPCDRPVVYVTLGSSGPAHVMPIVLDALKSEPVSVVVATAGAQLDVVSDNIWSADFLPGQQAAERSSLVICNGGSPTSMQALAASAPVIGIASNLDQYLNMSYLAKAGLGCLLRSDCVTSDAVRQASCLLLGEKSAGSMGGIATKIASLDAGSWFVQFISRLLSK